MYTNSAAKVFLKNAQNYLQAMCMSIYEAKGNFALRPGSLPKRSHLYANLPKYEEKSPKSEALFVLSISDKGYLSKTP
jgi:hypothetical protein